MDYNSILYFVSSVGTVMAAVAAAVSASSSMRQIRQSKVSFEEEFRHERIHRTLEAYNKLEESSISYLYQITGSTLSSIAANSRSKEYKDVTQAMNRLESFAVGLELGTYDSTVIDCMELMQLTRLYINLKPMIQTKRNISHSDEPYSHLMQWGELLRKRYPNIK